MISPGDKVISWRQLRWNTQAKWRCGMAAVGDSAHGKMDRRTAADGNGRICESLVISTSEGGQTYYMTISRTDHFTIF
jgi:hypothetical protein